TGRPHRASIQYYETLELNTPMINFNGAFIHHPRDEAWGVWHNPMPVETARKIVEAAYAYNVHNIIAEVQDHVYLDKNDERIVEIFRSTREDSPFTIGSLQHHLTTAPTSLLIHPRENHAERSEEHTSELQSRFDLVCRLLLEKKKQLRTRHQYTSKPLSCLLSVQ